MTKKIDYKSCGVDIEAGNEVVNRLKKMLPKIGGFSGIFSLKEFATMQEPCLVSATDGVGTKLKIAFLLDKHDTVGIDLVAMSINDLITCGARPLFFLDYIGCHKVIPEKIEAIIKGIMIACQDSDCELLGGETAELSDMYLPQEYDLAGFAVGIVDKADIIDGSKIKANDLLIGLPSTGLHSNGYSLARHVLDQTYYEEMLIPTKIYYRDILALKNKGVELKGLAHITGGGLIENVPRIIPEGLLAEFDFKSWQVPDIFQEIQKRGQIQDCEMYKTFNMGIGMVLIVNEAELNKFENPLIIGKVKQK